MILTYCVTTGTVLLATHMLAEQWKSQVLTKKNWDDVIAELQPTVTTEITTIALEYMNPGQTAFTSKSGTELVRIGGIKGVRRMRKNGDLLIALAAQAERWNPEGTRSLVTQMRRDGAELRRGAVWLAFNTLLYGQDQRGMLRVQKVAAAYYRMIFRLLDAVREFSPNDLASLSNAIWN